jgi:hypothetical protein
VEFSGEVLRIIYYTFENALDRYITQLNHERPSILYTSDDRGFNFGTDLGNVLRFKIWNLHDKPILTMVQELITARDAVENLAPICLQAESGTSIRIEPSPVSSWKRGDISSSLDRTWERCCHERRVGDQPAPQSYAEQRSSEAGVGIRSDLAHYFVLFCSQTFHSVGFSSGRLSVGWCSTGHRFTPEVGMRLLSSDATLV